MIVLVFLGELVRMRAIWLGGMSRVMREAVSVAALPTACTMVDSRGQWWMMADNGGQWRTMADNGVPMAPAVVLGATMVTTTWTAA